MNLSDWLKQTFTHISLEKQLVKNGQTLVIPDICIELTYGLLSTNDLEEFSKLVFHLAPAGVIVDKIDPEYYEGRILLLRNYLTKHLLEDKSFMKFLNVLERRDAKHWLKDSGKSVEVKQDKEDNSISIKFEVKE